jgi:hypothetical protein
MWRQLSECVDKCLRGEVSSSDRLSSWASAVCHKPPSRLANDQA